jgi:hypothetical protein
VKSFPAGPEEGAAATESVLIRPDGYVAWAAPGGGYLAEALRRWFGTVGQAHTGGQARATDDPQPLVSAR